MEVQITYETDEGRKYTANLNMPAIELADLILFSDEYDANWVEVQ